MKRVYTYVAILVHRGIFADFVDISHESAQHQRDQGRPTPPCKAPFQAERLRSNRTSLSRKSSLRPRKGQKKALTRTVGLQSTSCARSTGCLRSKTPTKHRRSRRRERQHSAHSRRPARWNSCLLEAGLRTGITGDDVPSPAARYQSIERTRIIWARPVK